MKKNRISRRSKSKLRVMALCLTGNPEERKSRYSKSEWVLQKYRHIYWMKSISLAERRDANTLR